MKKSKAIEVNFVLNSFKEKPFAKGANRQHIMRCTELGLSLEEFIQVSFSSVQKIDKELGLYDLQRTNHIHSTLIYTCLY